MKKVLFNKLWLPILLGIDVLSKICVLQWIPPVHGCTYPFGGVGIFQLPGFSFSLNLISNTGAAWGIFPNHLTLLLFLRIAIAGALLIYLLFFKSRQSQFPLWLIVTGATGNIIDMLYYGQVIDFLHFRIFGWSFPFFNIADSCITIGAILLLFRPKEKSKQVSDAN